MKHLHSEAGCSSSLNGEFSEDDVASLQANNTHRRTQNGFARFAHPAVRGRLRAFTQVTDRERLRRLLSSAQESCAGGLASVDSGLALCARKDLTCPMTSVERCTHRACFFTSRKHVAEDQDAGYERDDKRCKAVKPLPGSVSFRVSKESFASGKGQYRPFCNVGRSISSASLCLPS